MTEEIQVGAIWRRQARSGQVGYGDPVILHDTSRSRIQCVPFFIRNSKGTALSLKLEAYQKRKAPLGWLRVNEKALSLTEPSALKLLEALRQHFTVAGLDEDGEYLAIKVSEGTANLRHHDPAEVAQALTSLLASPDVLAQIPQTKLADELMQALRGLIRLTEMRDAVEQLRDLLDSGEAHEQRYQSWCEEHSWAFGNAYVMRDSVREITPGDHLDLLLPNVLTGLRDIVELKRPDMPVLLYDHAHRNYYFSQDASKAIGQCHRYLDVLHDMAANGLRDHEEIVAYHPRAVIVIGRAKQWPLTQTRALHGLNQRLYGITVMTYDHLLLQGERLISLFGAQVP